MGVIVFMGVLGAISSSYAFMFCHNKRTHSMAPHVNSFSKLLASSDPIVDMTVDEMKAELDVRGIGYEDCVSKNELSGRLLDVRNNGKASPDIIDQFNEYKEEIKSEIFDSDVVQEMRAKDGSLPGGLSPEIMKAMSSDPYITQMLKDPKMQAIMKDVMTGGPEALKKYLSDPDAMMLLDRLSKAMDKIVGNR
eukprot:gene13125-27738_t